MIDHPNGTRGLPRRYPRTWTALFACSAFACSAFACSAICATASAQEVQIATEKAPHYVNTATRIRISVQGFDEDPQPTCRVVSTPPELQVQVAAINPQVSSFQRIVSDPTTGQLKRSVTKSVIYSIDLQVTAGATGKYTLGPFVIEQKDKQVEARAITLEFRDVAIDPDARVRLAIPDGPLYPSQRVSVSIEFGYSGDFHDIQDFQIYSPLFDQFPFAPDARPGRDHSILPIRTKEGMLGLAAEVSQQRIDGRDFTFLKATRTLIPDRPGEFALKPIETQFSKVTQWARSRSPFDDLSFGGGLFDTVRDRKRPAALERVKTVGEPKTVVVKPLPLEGRPESFSGAVGSNFSLDVAAARSEVRVGDPITLTLKLRGEGNIDELRLPHLSADGGLGANQFRLPDGDVGGRMEEGAKLFDVTVRVTDENVKRIPPIAYSWFDPVSQSYQTARSKPIALNVMPARIVSSADVVSGTPKPAASSTEKAPSEKTSEAQLGRHTSSYTLGGADLSIELDPDRLLRDSRTRLGGTAVQVGLYVVGLALLGLAVLARKRSDIPPEVLQRRKRLRRQRQTIEDAGNHPQQQGAEAVAAALRAMVAEVPSVQRESIDSVVVECETLAYAPYSQQEDSLNATLLRRALTAADQIIKEAE